MQYKIINGAVYYDSDMVLENVDFEINDNEKIAVVGRNGCGKSTLLKAITGEVELEEGTGENEFRVIKVGKPEIGYLKQMPFEDESTSMIDEVRKVFQPLIDMEQKMLFLTKQMEKESDDKVIREYTDLNDRYIRLGGLTYQKEYHTMIRSFQFTAEDEQKPVSEFSGGQRTKIAFMKMLLSKPDILLLDEPTNHLDIETIQWLENYLKTYKSALVIVSHDRMFLDRIVDKVYEIEWGETKCYKGDYSSFEEKKRENYMKQQKDHDLQQAEIQRITKLIERFRYKATKAKMVQSKIKLLEHMKIIDAPNRYDTRTFRSNFQPQIQSSRQVLTVTDMTIGYDTPLAKISLSLERGQKIGIIGENGIGKSTLLKTLMGDVAPLSGSFSFGYHTEIGYFDQQLAQISGNVSLFDAFSSEYPSMNDTQVRTALGSFQFSGDDVFRPVSSLSGGEKVRLTLCKILYRHPNVLILDEPTNHMDIIGKEVLETILSTFEGTILFVSHDRYFVKKIADRLLVFEKDGAKYYPMSYDEYEEKKAEKLEKNEANVLLKSQTEQPKKSSSKEYNVLGKEKARKQRQIEKLEQLLNQCDEQIEALNKQLENPEISSNYTQLTEIQNNINHITNEQNKYMEDWSNLVEELEQLEKTE